VAYGGQHLPRVVAAACNEMWNAANLSFALCPLLSDGAIDALLIAGTEAQRATYLPKLVSGEWAGTMNLTEAQAGSDLAQVKTRAIAQADGRYRLFGQKIFITYGEHDFCENIVHLVLARLPDAPSGVKGLSLFLVPKFWPLADGAAGERNDVACVSLEHKLGIHGSPTAVLQFGEQGGAWGELVGAPNQGLQTMFIMMNAARFGVGVQGIGIADRAYQAARAYAQQRVQGRPPSAVGTSLVSVHSAHVAGAGAGGPQSHGAASAQDAASQRDSTGNRTPRPIVSHPDVRRMLATMRALTEGARALAMETAAASDFAHFATDPEMRRKQLARHEYLVPIVKGWSTEMAVEVASLAVQVHGGSGFIEETGVAQYYRDARILPIYEGTTAIQANDLVGRKTVKDGGEAARKLVDAMDATLEALARMAGATQDSPFDAMGSVSQVARAGERAKGESVAAHGSDALALSDADRASFVAIAIHLQVARDAFVAAVEFVVGGMESDPVAVYAGSVPYLKLAGLVLSGWQLARGALLAHAVSGQPYCDAGFAGEKLAIARFFAETLLPQCLALRVAVVSGRGGEGVWAWSDEQA
jgi:alkylation response protein AidB-like acyl-CoA dehydrogenase